MQPNSFRKESQVGSAVQVYLSFNPSADATGLDKAITVKGKLKRRPYNNNVDSSQRSSDIPAAPLVVIIGCPKPQKSYKEQRKHIHMWGSYCMTRNRRGLGKIGNSFQFVKSANYKFTSFSPDKSINQVVDSFCLFLNKKTL